MSAPEANESRFYSPYSFQENVCRVLWSVAQNTIFRLTFHNWYRIRRVVLRVFGAKVGPGVRIRRTVHIEIPWNLTIDADASVGDRAILYCLGPVHIKERASISQGAHICAGSHDYRTRRMPLLRPPITIGADAWIAADAFVGPSVEVGEGAILGARGCTMTRLEPWTIYAGNPAVRLKDRPKF